MDQFDNLFTPPESPTRNPDLRENILAQIRTMDRELEAERRRQRAQQFMNLSDDRDRDMANQQQVTGDVAGASASVQNTQNNPASSVIQHANPVVVNNEYNSFNLANVTPPVAPKWKNNDNLLDEYRKLQRSCIRIFDGAICHVTSGKVKTNMFLIWAGPDGEDIYENFKLTSVQRYDLDYVIM